jgi:membrane protein YdbS with pleckstrin-like domain
MEGAAPNEPGIRLPPSDLPPGAMPGRPDSPDFECTVQNDQPEEIDVWYGSYAGSAMLPRFVQLLLLSILIAIVAWYMGAWRGYNAARYTALSMILALWLLQAILWIRRLMGWNYRLTSRRLFVERGFRHPGQPGVDLERISQIAVEAGRLERWLDVGRLRIFIRDAPAPLILEGVRHPFHVARQIQRRSGSALRSNGGG